MQKVSYSIDKEVEDKCEIGSWKSNCIGAWRRVFVENTYRDQINQELYNQKDLNAYMNKRNHNDKDLKLII